MIISVPEIVFFTSAMIIAGRKKIMFRPNTINLLPQKMIAITGLIVFVPQYRLFTDSINCMLHRIRLGFRNASAMAILAIGEKVLAGMSGNPSFPDPPVSMEILERALDDFSRAIQAQATGGTLATATRNNARRKSDEAFVSARPVC